MKSFHHPAWTALVLAALALAMAGGCHDINTGRDDRTGRGKGDQLPSTGNASQGTNATTGDVTTEGPGSRVVGRPVSAPSVSTPYGGDGAGAAPPVSPGKGMRGSGEANSGQQTGKLEGAGSDASTENARPNPTNTGGPGTGSPPR